MGFYITSIGESTTGYKEADADKIFQAIESAAWDEKWDHYGWANKVRGAFNLDDIFNKAFGIKMRKEDDVTYLEFEEVYESDFFDSMFDIMAPYMTSGVMYLDKEYTEVALTFEEGKVVEHYGDAAEEVYAHSMFDYISKSGSHEEDFDIEIEN